MSATATLPPTWSDNLRTLRAYLDAHAGRFPSSGATDQREARLVAWWLEQNSPVRRERMSTADLAALDALREHADQLRERRPWDDYLAEITAYVDAHNGRFPPNRSGDQQVTALGCWWVAQNIALNRARMTSRQLDDLAQLRAHAGELREQARARHAAQVAEVARVRARAATIAAGRAGARAARAALKSEHLIPGDAEVLQLRISHPDRTYAELAQLAGMTPGRWATKYRGALNRGPNSRRPLPKDPADRLLAPGAAADRLGVSRAVLSRWTDAGLVTAQRSLRGHRQYLGREIERVKGLSAAAGGWPAAFTEAAGTPLQ